MQIAPGSQIADQGAKAEVEIGVKTAQGGQGLLARRRALAEQGRAQGREAVTGAGVMVEEQLIDRQAETSSVAVAAVGQPAIALGGVEGEGPLARSARPAEHEFSAGRSAVQATGGRFGATPSQAKASRRPPLTTLSWYLPRAGCHQPRVPWRRP